MSAVSLNRLITYKRSILITDITWLNPYRITFKDSFEITWRRQEVSMTKCHWHFTRVVSRRRTFDGEIKSYYDFHATRLFYSIFRFSSQAFSDKNEWITFYSTADIIYCQYWMRVFNIYFPWNFNTGKLQSFNDFEICKRKQMSFDF